MTAIKTLTLNDEIYISHCNFFVLRTPLLPFCDLEALGEHFAPGSTGDRIVGDERAWKTHVDQLRVNLRAMIRRPEILQALSVASPSLQSALHRWEEHPDSKKGIQVERSLIRYIFRMANRSTPFGLFSGCSLGSIDPTQPTELTLAARHMYTSSTRLDYDYLVALTDAIRADHDLRREMQYELNSSLNRSGEEWHYIESRTIGSRKSQQLVKLSNDEYLETLISLCKGKQQRFAQLVDGFSRMHDVSSDEIIIYLSELIDSQVLISTIIPTVTGTTPIDEIITELANIPPATGIHKSLAQVATSLASLDERIFEVTPHEYDTVASHLDALPVNVDRSRLFQVDMFKPLRKGNLSQQLLDEVYRAVDVLTRLGSFGEPPSLTRFRDAFIERYEQQWVPLAMALDPEIGLSYGGRGVLSGGSPLLKGLRFPVLTSLQEPKLPNLHAMLLNKIAATAKTGDPEISLTLQDLSGVKNKDAEVPSSIAVLATLIPQPGNPHATDDADIFVKAVAGPSSAILLGRFCSASKDLERFVREVISEEEATDPDATFAEIVYLPEGRLGNVICRPVLREYEIVYLGRSGASLSKQLPIDDLLVGVFRGRITLFSERLQRRVIPRLSNAHNYHHNPTLPAIYQFLGDLQHEGGVGIRNFDWGPLVNLDALPRVRCGRTILAPAYWRISKSEIDTLQDIDRYAAYRRVKEIQEVRGLPRWILLCESDRTLLVDLDNPLSIDAFVHVLRRFPHVVISEIQSTTLGRCVSGPEGSYEHELVIPLAIKRPRDIAASRDHQTKAEAELVKALPRLRDIPRNVRLRALGDEWRYIKLYGGPAIIEEILVDHIAPVLNDNDPAGDWFGWFFVRYADPEPHIRLRLKNPPDRLWYAVSNIANASLMSGKLWKIQLDTYSREIERYGGLEAMAASEEIFCADSVAVVDMLRVFGGEGGLDARWRACLVSIDRLMSDLGCDAGLKLSLFARLRKQFAKEKSVSGAFTAELGARFRKDRRLLADLLFGHGNLTELQSCDETRAILEKRSHASRDAMRLLKALDVSGLLCCPLEDIISNHVHMTVNRMMRSSPREHEVVLYDLLFRLYQGELARRPTTNR